MGAIREKIVVRRFMRYGLGLIRVSFGVVPGCITIPAGCICFYGWNVNRKAHNVNDTM